MTRTATDMREAYKGAFLRIVHARDLRDPIHEVGVRVVGRLDLAGRTLEHPLVLQDCVVEQEIVLRQADIPRVDLSGSHLWGLDAEQLHTRHDLDLSDVTTSGREIFLVGAHIGGCLLLTGARLSNVNDLVLRANGAIIEQDLYARGITTRGEVNLYNARVTGSVDLSAARLSNPGRNALTMERVEVGTLSCGNGFTATGHVTLLGAHVRGHVSFSGANIANGTGDALNAIGLVVDGAMYFHDGFATHGPVLLANAQIRNGVNFLGAHLSAPCDDAFDGSSMTVGQHFQFTEDSVAHGAINLSAARVHGMLAIGNVTLTCPGNDALNAQALTVDQNVMVIGCEVDGRVQMIGAHVRGQVVLRNATASALWLNALTVDKDALLVGVTIADEVWAHGLRAGQDVVVEGNVEGDVSFLDAQVSGRLQLARVRLGDLDLEGLQANKLALTGRTGDVDLTNARVVSFEDDPQTWPETLKLRGFTYDVLEHDHAPVKQRIEWLRRNTGGYAPGIYDNLAAAYKRVGRLERARKVSIAKQWDRRSEFRPLGKLWNWMLYLTVGYGYRTNLAGLWLLALLGAGTAVFAKATPKATAPVVEPFNPFVYALDALLPIVDLGQQKAWVMTGTAQWCAWGLIAAGWILTTAVVAGITNALKRD